MPKPSRDEMMRMLYERHVSFEKDYTKEYRKIDCRNQLMKTASPKNLKQLLKIKTPPKELSERMPRDLQPLLTKVMIYSTVKVKKSKSAQSIPKLALSCSEDHYYYLLLLLLLISFTLAII